MAAMLVKYMQFSSLRQPLIDMLRHDKLANCILQSFLVTCTPCQHYHCTPTYFAKRKKPHLQKEEQTKVLLTQYSEKQAKKRAIPVIQVWPNMTATELAKSANRDIDDVLYALSLTDGNTYEPNTVLKKHSVVYDAVKKLGGKVNMLNKENLIHTESKKNVDAIRRPPPDPSVLVNRPPVVTVMGHIDHGKTTLLDALRDTSVVQTEFGGITQHIGAFNVFLKTGEQVTFLDTPGHAAFNAIRARGVNVTDIVVLVVAADDGVMEQTVQSIEMAKDANVPIVVAINKIDKPEADIERTQNMLAQQGILIEQLGGEVQCINISALKKTNLESLIDAVILQAEIMELKGDPTGFAEGVVIECTNQPGRGKLATALIQRGTLRKGCVVVAGLGWAKVRSMFDHTGNIVLAAKPSEAVQIIGWRDLPDVGNEMIEVDSEKQAHLVMNYRQAEHAELLAKKHAEAADRKHEAYYQEYAKKRSLKKHRYQQIIEPRVRETDPQRDFPKVNVILKGDVAGSVEAILDALETYNEDDKCRLNIIHYGIGNVTESDLQLAETFNAVIYSFNVNTPTAIKDAAVNMNISIRSHKVIYKLIDDVKEEINNRLPYVDVEEVIGEASVLQEFKIHEGSKKINIAGCRCVKGVLKKSAMYRLVRNNETIYTGEVISMKHLKEEVGSVQINVECGLRFSDPTVKFQVGDKLICFRMVKQADTTKWDPGF